MQAYIDMEFPAALIHKMVFFYEIATYICENDQGYFVKQQLHVGDVVTIQEEIYSESYAIVEAIFSHQGNNEKLYAFVIVNWFEETSQTKLDCPIYQLDWKRWRHIFPISVIDLVNKVHFVHDCIGDMCKDSHDTKNNNYIKNKFYFTAV